MVQNVGQFDRLIRLLIGVFLVGWAVAGGPWWAYIGIIMIATAAWRFCPLYSLFRVSTQKSNS
jgi:hypothetical protein